MEVHLIGSSKAKIYRNELAFGEPGFSKSNHRSISSLKQSSVSYSRRGIRLTLKAVQSATFRSDEFPGPQSPRRSDSLDRIKVFVGLPLNTVSDSNRVNHSRAIAAGLRTLKLAGVEGVELPVWWGVAEKEAAGKYEWSGYLAVAEMVRSAGLKLHISFCFHRDSKVGLPRWVNQIGEAQPSIYFTDRHGKCYKECLSMIDDELPVLDGRSPLQAYSHFCENFKSSLSSFLGNTITGITMALGPQGELRHNGEFLSWYSNELISHANRMLSLASSIFSNTGVRVHGKVHPSEVTTSFNNTVDRNWYDNVAEIFARNSCNMVLPGLDLLDEHQEEESVSRPALLLAQACRKYAVGISGQNSSVLRPPGEFKQINKKLLLDNNVLDLFMYQRMGASFFSPAHFQLFTKFIRSLSESAGANHMYTPCA